MKRVAVIGAGWAGCAAAVALAQRGRQVTLFEAARTVGGRARRVDAPEARIDNGQHILLGAYTQTLKLMRSVGIDTARALLRLPLQMCYPGATGMQFVAPRLPAPLHLLAALLRARGLDRHDKLALARFSSTARWMGWQLATDCTVAELLDRFDQTDRLIALLWRPLCLAALNTPPERASAQVFLAVLRDSLGARRIASDMLIPRVDLSALFPDQAAKFVVDHGGTVRHGVAIESIAYDDGKWRLGAQRAAPGLDAETFDAVVVAAPAAVAAKLLGKRLSDEALAAMTALTHEPITTCYLGYAPTVQLAQPFFALRDDPSAGRWSQFVFVRGQLDAAQAGMLAVVISASSEAAEQGNGVLAASCARQLADDIGNPALAAPVWTKVITEKRATFSCTPGLVRPGNAVNENGLALAGDYTACDYPATLEGAVRSGLEAARIILDRQDTA